MRLRPSIVALCAGAILATALAGIAGAHVVQQFGPYSLATGWLHEPAYVGVDNAVQVIVKDAAGKSVDDVPASDFTVTVSTGGQTTVALPLNASFDPEYGPWRARGIHGAPHPDSTGRLHLPPHRHDPRDESGPGLHFVGDDV
jgi:hypothetical protein